MLSLAVAVVAIALPDCINPSLIGADLVLAAGQRPVRRTVVFALSAWIVTFLVGVALALGLGDLVLSIVPKPGASLKYALIAVAGLVLLVGGTVVWIRRKALANSGPPHHAEPRPRGSPGLLGAGIAGLEMLTAFPYFAAIAMITGSSVSNLSKLGLLVLYCAVYTLPLIGIAVVCIVLGRRAAGVIQPVVAWTFSRWPAIVGPLAAIIGVGLTAYGTVKLG